MAILWLKMGITWVPWNFPGGSRRRKGKHRFRKHQQKKEKVGQTQKKNQVASGTYTGVIWRRGLQGDFTVMFQPLKGVCRKDKDILWGPIMIWQEKMVLNEESRFSLGIGKKLCTVYEVVRYWNRLSREAVDAVSWKCVRSSWKGLWAGLWCLCRWQGVSVDNF